MNNGLYSQSCGDIAAAVQSKRMAERQYEGNAKQCATEQYQNVAVAGLTMPKCNSVSEELSELRNLLAETRGLLDSISEIVVGSYPKEELDYRDNERLSLIAQAVQCKQITLSLFRISNEIKSAL